MFLDYYGKELPDGAIEREERNGGYAFAIWWNKVPLIVKTHSEINEALDKLDELCIARKETRKGCRTISMTHCLGEGYFIRESKNDVNRIEVCGACIKNGNTRLFRFAPTQGDADKDVLAIWIKFQNKVREHTGKSLREIFGGLPLEYLEYRYCVPSPINWASSYYTNHVYRVAEGCHKADMCSAYGTQAAKDLPDCRISRGKKILGYAEPTEELPFAFYLKSGHMAIWNEGSTVELNQSRYITSDHTSPPCAENEITLLLPRATTSLASVFQDLYDSRKEDEINKMVMNVSIGMFHRRDVKYVEDNLWPIAAVIKYRCNRYIVNTCKVLEAAEQHPILINTDSILWEGDWSPIYDELFTEEKALGNFAWENKNCRAAIRGPKCYQIQDAETKEVVTRWSGRAKKKYTSMLGFGKIWKKEIFETMMLMADRETIQWDKKACRYINRVGEVYEALTDEEKEVMLQCLKN